MQEGHLLCQGPRRQWARPGWCLHVLGDCGDIGPESGDRAAMSSGTLLTTTVEGRRGGRSLRQQQAIAQGTAQFSSRSVSLPQCQSPVTQPESESLKPNADVEGSEKFGCDCRSRYEKSRRVVTSQGRLRAGLMRHPDFDSDPSSSSPPAALAPLRGADGEQPPPQQ